MHNQFSDKKWKILYVEDCHEDVEAMKRSLNATEYSIDFSHISTFDEAMAFLEEIDNSKEESLEKKPDLMIFDLRLKGVPSFPLLQKVKMSSHLRSTPVLILSASEQDSDLNESCALGATAYIKKPFTLSDLKPVIKKSLDFWLTVAHRPQHWINKVI